MVVGIFAGIPVKDFQQALEWYKRLLGTEPSFYPNDIEAVWQLADDRYVYIIQDTDRAGGAVSMIWVDDPRSELPRSPSGAWIRSRSRGTTTCGSSSSTTPTATRPASAERWQPRNSCGHAIGSTSIRKRISRSSPGERRPANTVKDPRRVSAVRGLPAAEARVRHFAQQQPMA